MLVVQADLPDLLQLLSPLYICPHDLVIERSMADFLALVRGPGAGRFEDWHLRGWP